MTKTNRLREAHVLPRTAHCLWVTGLATMTLLLCACANHKAPPVQGPPQQQHAPAPLPGLKHGLLQSPINISSVGAADGQHAIRLHYGTSREHITNKGHTIELEYDPGSGVTFDGKDYQFKQLHFHTPSEHHIDGVIYPLEMHMVHTLEGNDGAYFVGAILFKEGPENPFLKSFLAQVPDKAQTHVDVLDNTVDVKQLFTGDQSYYHYKGSLTTPPYSETVTWCVAKTIHTASRAQIERIHALEGENARAIQDQHGRAIDKD